MIGVFVWKSIFTAVLFMTLISGFGECLSVSQINETHAQINAVNESNIVIGSNFTANTRITPSFIPFLNGAQMLEVSYDKSKPYAETGYIFAKSDNSNASANFSINVPKNVSFSVSHPYFNITSATKGNGTIRFYIENNGNYLINMTANATGNLSDNLVFAKTFDFTGAKNLFEMNYTAPNSTGLYSAILNLSSENFSKLVNISFTALDLEKPKITNYTFPEEMNIGEKYFIKFKAEDNINISQASVKIDTFNASANLTGGYYSVEYAPSSFGFFTVEMSAADPSGNKITESGQIHVIPMNATYLFRINNDIDFGTRIWNTTSLRNIFFRTDSPLNFTINKTSLSISNQRLIGDNATNYPQIILLYGDNQIDFGNMTSIEINNFDGGLAVDIIPNGWTFDYSGGLTLNLPKTYEYDGKISFKGSFKNYTMCSERIFNLFKYPLSFRAYDTGIYETSYCTGEMKYPADFNTDEDALVVVAHSERGQIFAEQNKIIKVWQDNTMNAYFIISILVLGIFTASGVILYLKIIYPKQG